MVIFHIHVCLPNGNVAYNLWKTTRALGGSTGIKDSNRGTFSRDHDTSAVLKAKKRMVKGEQAKLKACWNMFMKNTYCMFKNCFENIWIIWLFKSFVWF